MSSLKKYILFAFAVLFIELLIIYLYKRSTEQPDSIPTRSKDSTIHITDTVPDSIQPSLRDTPIVLISEIETKMIEGGLTNISELDSTILVDLKYSTKDNFLHKNMYGTFKKAYLQKPVAEKLVRAQQLLKQEFSYYSIIVFDAARPLSVQQTMWDEMQVPENQKDNYVSNPKVGSLHNYGCAVDVSIINESGHLLDMGTPYDFFGQLAHPSAEQKMITEGKLTSRQYENRILLRRIMRSAGFTPITSEWWHFNGSSLKRAGERYQLIK